jgi:phosphoglycolate phosphatase
MPTETQPNLQDIRLVIFDLDGTLIDSKADLVQSVNATRLMLGLAALDPETVSSYVGNGVAALMQRALDKATVDEEVNRAVELFLAYYHDHMLDHTVTYPGVREALAELGGVRMAVLTNKPVRFSREIIKGLGIDHHFTAVYGGNSFSQKKPDPVGVLTLMREAQVERDETLMVGDSETDIQTGRNAGVRTCGVTYGLGRHTLEAWPPDVLLDDLRQLPALIRCSTS